MNWYAIYTNPKTEDIVSQKLRNTGIEVYYPKLRIKKYRSGRYCEVIDPLFPSYVFAQSEPDKYLRMISYIFQQCVKGTERVILLLNVIGYQPKVVVERASIVKVS
jgi:hypothetical protein